MMLPFHWSLTCQLPALLLFLGSHSPVGSGGNVGTNRAYFSTGQLQRMVALAGTADEHASADILQLLFTYVGLCCSHVTRHAATHFRLGNAKIDSSIRIVTDDHESGLGSCGSLDTGSVNRYRSTTSVNVFVSFLFI